MTFVLGNLRGTLAFAELAAKCRSHSVMISPVPDLHAGGSGTLVRYKDLCGILTATHVIAGHTGACEIYSPLLKTPDPTLFLNIGIPTEDLVYLETAEGIKALQEGEQWAAGSLDICLIQLDPLLFDHLLQISGKQAVDLLEHKTKYLADPGKYSSSDRNHDWCWAVDGAPREGADQNSRRVLESKFDGLYVAAGSMEGSTYRTDPLTLVAPPFNRDADRGRHDLGPTSDTLPDSFGGISGGGMWQVNFRGENGIPDAINEIFFSGVCVAGIPHQCLYSRGPSALYDIFTAHLDTLLFKARLMDVSQKYVSYPPFLVQKRCSEPPIAPV